MSYLGQLLQVFLRFLFFALKFSFKGIIFFSNFGNVSSFGFGLSSWIVGIACALSPTMLFVLDYKISSYLFGFYVVLSGVSAAGSVIDSANVFNNGSLYIASASFFGIAGFFSVYGLIASCIAGKRFNVNDDGENAKGSSLSALVFVWFGIYFVGLVLDVVGFSISYLNFFQVVDSVMSYLNFCSGLLPFVTPIILRNKSLKYADLVKLIVVPIIAAVGFLVDVIFFLIYAIVTGPTNSSVIPNLFALFFFQLVSVILSAVAIIGLVVQLVVVLVRQRKAESQIKSEQQQEEDGEKSNTNNGEPVVIGYQPLLNPANSFPMYQQPPVRNYDAQGNVQFDYDK